MSKTIYHIYDKTFKKILTLSSKSVVNLINGLFHTNYPPDSTISYNWTEFENRELKRILADTILTINGKYSYHLEAQMTEDEDIIFRIFEYSYNHADRNRISSDSEYSQELFFPEPKIIYFSSSEHTPDEYTLKLNFGSQGHFIYRVSTFKFLESTLEELNQKKLVILIPFQLLKLRKSLLKNRSKENLESLKSLIQNDIIGSIETNLSFGNITVEDAQLLRRLTHRLYHHIYAHYEEMEELNEMTDESLILDVDILLKKLEQEKIEFMQKTSAELNEKITAEITAEITQKVTAEKEAEIASMLSEINKQAQEIEQLKLKLQTLQNQ